MTRDFLHSLLRGLLDGCAYVLFLVLGVFLAKPEIDALLEVLP